MFVDRIRAGSITMWIMSSSRFQRAFQWTRTQWATDLTTTAPESCVHQFYKILHIARGERHKKAQSSQRLAILNLSRLRRWNKMYQFVLESLKVDLNVSPLPHEVMWELKLHIIVLTPSGSCSLDNNNQSLENCYPQHKPLLRINILKTLETVKENCI